MFRFFRQLRQHLLTENKFNRYLLYALGEIALVVIGILLALQIDTWNESKKQGQASRDFLLRLQQEVQQNIQYTEAEIRVEIRQVESSKRILQFFNTPLGEVDPMVLDSLMYIIFSNNTLEVSSGTLTEGFNTGTIAIIEPDSLRVALYNLPTVVEEIRQQEAIDRDDVNGDFKTYLYENYNFRNMDNGFSPYQGEIGQTKFQSYDNLTVLSSPYFENMIDNRFWNCQRQLNQLQKFSRELLRIDEIIKNVLGND